jgi:DNA-binding winged helix-turn-helix (wHTH) protein
VLYRFGDCELDARRFELRRGGEPIPVEPQVFELLSYLLEHRERAVTRTELNDVVWKGRIVTDAALNSRIKAARAAIGDDGKSQSSIRTLHRTGYRFVGPVDVVVGSAAAPTGGSSAVGAPAAEPATPTAADAPTAPTGRSRWALAAVVGALAILCGGVATIAVQRESRPSEVPTEVVQLAIPDVGPPARQPFGLRHVAISANGNRVAYASRTRLWIRRLSEAVPVTVEAAVPMNPFFSPDGEWLGYFADSALMKVRSDGGMPLRLRAVTERPAGAAWGADGRIVFATVEGLFRVNAEGGDAELLAKPVAERGERLYAWPAFLPGDASLLFTVFYDEAEHAPEIVRFDLRTREHATLLADAAAAQFSSSGHLVYAANEMLHVVPFDARAGTTRGVARRLENYRVAMAPDNGAAEFAFADSGTLVTIPPGPEEGLLRIVWVDRSGQREPLDFPPRRYGYPRVSPDGKRLALDIPGANRDIWIADLARGDLMRLTAGPTEDLMPLWSPDGRRIYFGSDRAGTFDIYSQPADGSDDARPELVLPGFQTPLTITPAGDRLVIYENFRDIDAVDLRTATSELLVAGDVGPGLAELSPDGRFLAYESREAGGTTEIFVRPFPDVHASRTKVSAGGGRYPRWSRFGAPELYFVSPEGSFMAVPASFDPDLRLGDASPLFAVDEPPPTPTSWPYDVSPVDGRFVFSERDRPTQDPVTNLTVVLNWARELREVR